MKLGSICTFQIVDVMIGKHILNQVIFRIKINVFVKQTLVRGVQYMFYFFVLVVQTNVANIEDSTSFHRVKMETPDEEKYGIF